MKWKLSLFGPFRLERADGKLFRSKSDKSKVMLAFLASQQCLHANRRMLGRALFDLTDVPSGPNLALLLTRTQSALLSHNPLPLLCAAGDQISLIEGHFESDFMEMERLARCAKASTDSIEAGLLWREAVMLAEGQPLSDLEHPILVPVRQKMGAMVLQALEGLATSPLGRQNATLIGERLNQFQFLLSCDAVTVEPLMRIFAAMGMKEELIQTFESYESRLDYQCGEEPPQALVSLQESLLSSLDRPHATVCGVAPEKPRPSLGRDSILDELCHALRQQESPWRVTTLTGQSGIGKSHVMRELFWRLSPEHSLGFFDLETQPLEVAKRLLHDQPCEVVFLDHLQEDHAEAIEQLIIAHPNTRFTCAGHARLGVGEERLVTLTPLGVGTALNPGPAVQLLSRNLSLVHPEGAVRSDQERLFELACLCDGIPLALEIAGRLSGSIGIAATISSLRRNLDGLTNGGRNSGRRASLRNAVECSYRNLGDEAKLLVALLSGLGDRCHTDQLLECAEARPCDLEEAILSGLVVKETYHPYVRVLPSTATFVSAVENNKSLADARFYTNSVAWFARRSSELPLDLGVAESVPLATAMVGTLFGSGQRDEAIALLAAIRPWLGSIALSSSRLETIEQALMRTDGNIELAWPEAVLSLSAAYFHSGLYHEMEIATERAMVSMTAEASSDVRCQLKMQNGLAKRAMYRFDEAIACYRDAVATADSSVSKATLVKCYYNLGTLLESQERLAEAMEAYGAASDLFSEDTDPRVECLVNTCIGRLHYRQTNDLDSATLILEATLAHARERQDRRSAGEVLQNLGQIYFERGQYAKSALAETVGTGLVLEFGYSEPFRQTAKSSYVTLCACLFELGFDSLARAARTMIDRLGPSDLYFPNKKIFEQIAAKTYQHAPGLKLGIAAEADIRKHLDSCLEQLDGLSSKERVDWLEIAKGA